MGTAEALVTRLLRYGLAVTGSGVAEQILGKVDANIVNVLVRRILGVNRTARLPILHALSGMMSIRSLYTQNCALMVDLVMRKTNGSPVAPAVQGRNEEAKSGNSGTKPIVGA